MLFEHDKKRVVQYVAKAGFPIQGQYAIPVLCLCTYSIIDTSGEEVADVGDGADEA